MRNNTTHNISDGCVFCYSLENVLRPPHRINCHSAKTTRTLLTSKDSKTVKLQDENGALTDRINVPAFIKAARYHRTEKN